MLKSIVAPLIVVAAIWVATSTMTTYFISHIEQSHQDVIQDMVLTIEAVSDMQGLIWRLHSLVMAADEGVKAEAGKKLTALVAEFQTCLSKAEPSCTTQAEVESLREIRAGFAEYRKRLLTELSTGTDISPADDAQLRQLAREITNQCRRLHDINKELLTASTRDLASLVRKLNMARHLSAVIGPVVGGLVGYWISRRLHRSVAQISVSLDDVVGRLEHDVGRVVIQPSSSLPFVQQQVEAVALRIQGVLDELQEARYQVMAAERLAVAGELAAGVAHEIRNPLTSVKLLIQIAVQRGPEHRLDDKQLQVIQTEIARMEKTIQGLLDFAKPPRLHRVVHDVRDTMRRAINLVGGRARQHRITICEEFSTEQQTVDADPEQLHQVLVNLLLNAVEAMPEGGQIHIDVARDQQFGSQCRIVIHDSGPGIDPEVFPRIFEPFVSTKKDGTGLGLAVSRRIIDEHGGTIDAANQEGGGASFTITLPLSAVPLADAST
jgi:signal transduction histidine kinase